MPGATLETGLSETGSDDKSSSNRGERIAKAGTLVSAIMASSCCWLPPLLLVFGVSGAGMIAAIEEYRTYMMVVTFSFLGMAFYFTYRPRQAAAGQEDCCAPAVNSGPRRFTMMTMNKDMLWTVTALAIVFLFFPQFVTGMLASDTGEFTADMNRSTVKIAHMTCFG